MENLIKIINEQFESFDEELEEDYMFGYELSAATYTGISDRLDEIKEILLNEIQQIVKRNGEENND